MKKAKEPSMQWAAFASAEEALRRAGYELRALALDAQLEILRDAILSGEERLALRYLQTVEPLDQANSERSLTLGLADLLASIALFPGNSTHDARESLAAASSSTAVREAVAKQAGLALEEADGSDDYQVYALAASLLGRTGNEAEFQKLLDRIRRHPSASVRELEELLVERD